MKKPKTQHSHPAPAALTRRQILRGSAAFAGATLLSGCDWLNESDNWRETLYGAEKLTKSSQRALIGRTALAPEFAPEHISKIFPSNGTKHPGTPEYQAHVDSDFTQWQVAIDGLVDNPQSLSLAAIKQLPETSIITRLDCVEGWSAIGKWTGTRLSNILNLAKPQSEQHFAVFHCADKYGDTPYYESLDMIDARHPQTLLCWALNDEPLPIGNGAPLRVIVPRQLGYKNAKYVNRIEIADDLSKIYRGRGGYWEDVGHYEWYAGI